MSYWEKANHSWTKDSIRKILTPSSKNKTLFFYIQEIGHFKADKPYYTERANLSSYLIKYTLSGEGRLVYDDKEFLLTRGSVFFIDCEKYQFYETVSEDPWEMIWIHFYGSTSKGFYDEFIRSGTNVFNTDPLLSHYNKIQLLISSLLQLQSQQDVQTDFKSSLMIHELLNELIMQKFQLDFDKEEIPTHVISMKKLLDSNFHQNITLEQLENQFYLNKYQLNKDFSRFIGIPPIDYQINKKINYAKDALRFSDKSIKEIAEEVGITNHAYFSRLFKKRTGISASEYRKNG